MDNYQAMNFYYGLLNLHAGLFRANLCEDLMIIAQNVPDPDRPEAAYQKPSENKKTKQNPSTELQFGSFYDDGHILHNVKIETQSDFFLDPTRGDAIQWHVSFTVAKDVRPADQFIVQLSDNLIVAPNGHPQKPIADFVDQDGIAIAMGEYHPDKHQLVYTFTNYVAEHEKIYGEITGELTIDPITVPETEFGMNCYIEIDKYRREFTVDADYPDLDTGTFLGVSSRMMSFDADKHIFTDLIYVNPAEKQLDHGYIIFNTSEMVEELSNAVVSPSTMRVEVFQNARHLKLPQSYGVDLRRLRDVTNRFPAIEGDHLVETPQTISFADNKMRLNFNDGNSTDSYVIRVTGQYNDELDGAVRLRARLFGVDQTNVYMSNSTAATIKGITMSATGTAVVKEENSAPNDLERDMEQSEDAPVDELATTTTENEAPDSEEDQVPAPTVVVDDHDELRPAKPTKVEQEEDKPATSEAPVEREEVEKEPIDESVAELESGNATEYDRRFAKLLKKNMAKIRRGEKVVVESQEESQEEKYEDVPVEEHHIKVLQPTEVFLPQSSTIVEEETVASTSEVAETVDEPVDEENEMSTTESTPASMEFFTSAEPAPSIAEEIQVPASEEPSTTVPVVEVTTEESPVEKPVVEEDEDRAPLPMPKRRPPRRVGRFERYPERTILRHKRRR